MHTFFGTLRDDLRRRRLRRCVGEAPRHPGVPGSEDGFLLIEVIISAALVGLIVLATFSGFDVVNRLTAEQRRHDEAALLAAQSQEQLRSDPSTTLDTLETNPHKYSRTVGGTVFTISQEAQPVNSAGNAVGCNANETTAKTGANIRVTSTVTWTTLEKEKRPPVSQTSVITPPTGSGLEVDVTNGASTPAPVPGVTVTAKYIPVEAGSPASAEGTTAAGGCVVFTAIPSTLATVEIAEKLGFVTTSGALKYPNKELTLAPNITTHDPVTYAEGGGLTAQFTYKGETTWEGKEVKGDTFVAYNANLVSPSFEIGSTAFKYEAGGEERYQPLTGTYKSTASTPAGTRYPSSDLFPFPATWAAYAGDCTKNKPPEGSPGESKVESGKFNVVKIPMSYVALKVHTGTRAEPKTLAKGLKYAVKITNTECEPIVTPNNATTSTTAHAQLTSEAEGAPLENPFQPFGAATLCLANGGRLYKTSYANKKVEGSTLNLDVGELTVAENETNRTNAETTTRTAREATEAANVTQWKKEYTPEGKISKTTYENKVKAQETAKPGKRTEEENARKTARTKEETEENAAGGFQVTAGASC